MAVDTARAVGGEWTIRKLIASIFATTRDFHEPTMKSIHTILAVAVIALVACDKPQTTSEKVKDNVNDALDRRPGEKVRDAAEDAKDAVKDAAKDVKGAVKDAAK